VEKMNKNLLITIVIIATVLIGGFAVINKQSSSQKQVINLGQVEKKVAQDLGLKEGKVSTPSYPEATIDEEKCGKDAFYVKEKSADFVKNYCKFLRDNGWKLVHQDYSDCEEISSFGGGYNYNKGQEKIAVSVMKYGEDAACFWVYKR